MITFDIFKNWGFPGSSKSLEEMARGSQYGTGLQNRTEQKSSSPLDPRNYGYTGPMKGRLDANQGVTANQIQAKNTMPFDPSQGGTNQSLAGDQHLSWLAKLTGTNMDKAMAHWKDKGGFEGYNEAGLKTGNIWGGSGSGGDGNINTGDGGGGGDGERARMNTIAPHAPYIVSGTTPPSTSVAQNWYQSLGGSTTNSNAFNLATEFAAAKSKQAAILGNSSAVGMLAANQTPYFDFLQKHSLTKGIL